MSKFRILVTDKIDPKGLEPLQNDPSCELVMAVKPSAATLEEEVPKAEAWLVRSETKITADWLEKAQSLKLIGRAGVGVDNIDVRGASRRGIAVVNAPAANTISACEHTVGLILSLARNIASADACMKAGGWNRSKWMGTELQGKTLGLAGFGRIGREVAKRARAFGMTVLAYDPFISEEQAEQFGVELSEFKPLLENSDYISLHIPVTEKTRGIINSKSLEWFKSGARLINCARGELIVEDDLVAALENGTIGGAALDVYDGEPLKEDSKLRGLSNVVLTPHLGASTTEAQFKVADELSKSVLEFRAKGLSRNAINLPGFDPDQLDALGSTLDLADKLGRFLGQTLDSGLKGVRCRFHGEFPDGARHPLSVAAVKGVLSTILDFNLSFINTPILAMERGIEISESTSPSPEGFTRLLTVTAVTDKSECSVSGTVGDDGKLRIVRLDDLFVDVSPEGQMLVLSNTDAPGIIGLVGSVLGKHAINIADMRVGRHSARGEAVMVITLDDEPSEAVQSELKNLKGINTVRWVVL
ncbi:MAG: phosphoglycerate dehydrogenase [Elusimicrobia bacterium]|nr:MAG: phosphoglycerate dehydrogenase [Elusimicrobiota bacterium]